MVNQPKMYIFKTYHELKFTSYYDQKPPQCMLTISEKKNICLTIWKSLLVTQIADFYKSKK